MKPESINKFFKLLRPSQKGGQLHRNEGVSFAGIYNRHQKYSTIITSQLPVNAWHQYINENTIADAILDRIIHQAIRLKLKGDSLRKIKK